MQDTKAVHLGEIFKSSRGKGHEGLPTLSVTLNHGLVFRDTLVRRTETNLSANEHLFVKKGDIAYNMMRAWQGALGRASSDGLVSPAYVVLRPTKKVDSLYAEYLFKTPRLIYLFWAYSYGLTQDRLRLYYNDFSKITVEVPEISTQKKIAQILSTWDNAILATERLLENSRQRKKALMQQLLTGKKRLPGFEGEWVRYLLSEVANIIVSPVDKKSYPEEQPVKLCNYTDVYYNTRISKSMSFMEATATASEIKKYVLKIHDVVITKDSETPGDIAVPALINEDLGGVLCGYHLAILRSKSEKLHGPFLSYLLSMKKTRYYFFTLATGATRFGLSVGAINNAEVKLPPVGEQEAISKILTTADQEIQALQNRLGHFKQEKKALMQQLLTGKRRVQVENAA